MLFAFFEHDFYVPSYLIDFQAFDEAHAGVRCHQDVPIVTIAEPHKEQQDNLVAQHGFLLNIHTLVFLAANSLASVQVSYLQCVKYFPLHIVFCRIEFGPTNQMRLPVASF